MGQQLLRVNGAGSTLGASDDVADDARYPLWNSDIFNSQLFCCYCLGIQGKGNHQRHTVYNLVGVGNINFDRLRSLASLSFLDLGGIGHRTMVAGRRLPFANQHDLACCAAQSVSEMGQTRPFASVEPHASFSLTSRHSHDADSHAAIHAATTAKPQSRPR
jgi:hypothetical protein